MKKNLKKISQNAVSGFDFSGKCGILCSVGCGNPMSQAEAAAVNGGELLEKSNIVDSIFESAGCALRNVTCDTITTPAGSFFVPDVVIGEKSLEKSITRRLTPCKANLQNVRNRSQLFNTVLSATTPPGVCPNFSMFRSTTPELL